MALAISTALQNHWLNSAFNAAAGITFDNGVLEFRSGAAPGPNAADAGTLLAAITLPADSMDAPAGGSISKLGTWSDTSADAAGTAAHFRIKQSGDTGGATGSTDERFEGTVTGTGGGGDIELDNVVIEAGQTLTLTSVTLTMPAS